jgi:3-methyladenine DNA glycosylase AlkC
LSQPAFTLVKTSPEMSYLLKDLYSKAFYNKFTDIAAAIVPAFDKKKFIRLIFDAEWESRELKERMKHTASVLHRFFPGNFEDTAKMIEKLIIALRRHGVTKSSLEYMFLPDYVETYGLDHYAISVKALEYITQFTSCEFAVRPFIIKYGDKMIKQMHKWSLHENPLVRRLASEGSRPRLPWALKVPGLVKDPAPILPILENLKNDPSETVRRSVANSLNDISKDHPGIVIRMVKQWKGVSPETDAIIKHGCRTLLKQGHQDMLKYYGLNNSAQIKVSNAKIATPKVKVGESLAFSFAIQNKDTVPKKVRMEYAIFYPRQNGQLSKKVFKIGERQFLPNEHSVVIRKQSFKIITTKKFYPGQHKLSIIINGQERAIINFELKT